MSATDKPFQALLLSALPPWLLPAAPRLPEQSSSAPFSQQSGGKRSGRRRLTKARKPTYYVRKEEMSALQKEVASLKAQVAVLQRRKGSASATSEESGDDATQVVNALLRDEVTRQQYTLARLQSAHASYVSTQQSIPFQSHIHLGADWTERRAALATAKPRFLLDAKRYLAGRAQCIDASLPHCECARFVTPRGDFCTLRFGITQFHGVQSVKQVFDALQTFFFSMEISISELLGDITIREDEQHQEFDAAQMRLVSNIGGGGAVPPLEINCATFSEFTSGASDGSSDDFGIVTTDFVDEDELYPYSPTTRVRQDVTAAMTVTPLRRVQHKRTPVGRDSKDAGDELVVVLMRCCFARLHHSELPISDHALQGLRERVGGWDKVILNKLQENLSASGVTGGLWICSPLSDIKRTAQKGGPTNSSDANAQAHCALASIAARPLVYQATSASTILQKGELLLAMLDDECALDHLMQTLSSVDEFAALCAFMNHLEHEQAGALDSTFTSAMDVQQAERATANYIAKTNAIHALKKRQRVSEVPPKKRKATYHVRKEEKAVLEQQIQALQAQIESLQSHSGALGSSGGLQTLECSLSTNQQLGEAVKEQQFSFAAVQSAMGQQVTLQHSLPFATIIKLPSNWRERRSTLMTAKPELLQNGLNYVIERTRFLDPSAAFAETTRYATSSGDFCSLVFDVIPFEGITNAGLVFDALQFYFHNMEISISELLGELTVREDDDSRLDGAFQNRIVSNAGHGVQVELNSAMFYEMCEPSALYGGGREFGLLVANIVDEDELFPYSAATRLRQDVTAAVTVTLQPRFPGRGSSQDEDEELMVVVTRTCLLNLRKTQLPIPSPVLQTLRDGIERWGDAMMKKARDIVYAQCMPTAEATARPRVHELAHECWSVNLVPFRISVERFGSTTTEKAMSVASLPAASSKRLYYVRNKEERAALRQQIKLLQDQVNALRAPQATVRAPDHQRIHELTNAFLRSAVHDHKLLFAGVHSALAAHTTTQASLPFETCICLGRDWDERQRTLLAMKDAKLRERTKFIDPATLFAETSRFTTPNGDYCLMHVDTTPFEGVSDLKLVYNALQNYFFNMEISLSELLRDIMIHEECPNDQHAERHDHSVSQNCFVSTLVDSDVQVEMNAVRFSTLHEVPSPIDERSFGVITGESIDDDALFPYSPAERVRQAVTAVLSITLEPKMKGQEEPGREDHDLVVVLTRVCLLKLRRTELGSRHILCRSYARASASPSTSFSRELVELPPMEIASRDSAPVDDYTASC